MEDVRAMYSLPRNENLEIEFISESVELVHAKLEDYIIEVRYRCTIILM